MKRPPVLLAVATISYLAYLAWLLISDFTPVVAGRLGLSAVLIFFVLRGSRVAGNILAVLCALSSLVLLVAAVATFSANALGAVVFTLISGLLAAFSAYLFFSPTIRAFQGKALPVSAA
jgi:hypothetical protein